MLVSLDDSGDPGFKLGKGSTPCFVIAVVIFDDNPRSGALRCRNQGAPPRPQWRLRIPVQTAARRTSVSASWEDEAPEAARP